jgi:hypothetical protein
MNIFNVNLDVMFQLSTLNDRQWREIEFKISGYNDESDDEIPLGYCKGNMISLPLDHMHLINISDEISQDCYDMCSEFESFDECNETLNYLILTSMEIDKKFRGNGVGLKAMNLLSEFFWNYTILLRPHPIEKSSDIESGIERLQKYWAESGFKRSGNSSVFFKVCL